MVVIYDKDYYDIAIPDLPKVGDVIVARDDYALLHNWVVGVMYYDPHSIGPCRDSRGLFFEKRDAIIFANALVKEYG